MPTPPRDAPLESLKTQPFARDLAMTRIGMQVGARLALHSVRNLTRDTASRQRANQAFYREQGMALAHQLGQLKGGLMKAGQLLALYGEYFLPAEAVEALQTLQDNSQPVAWAIIERQLTRQLGKARMATLDIDPQPIGAASLGQVHRARRRGDANELCLKVLYPGVAESVDSDMRTLERLLATSRLLPRSVDPKPMFGEVRQMLHQEIDYRRERHFTEIYGRRLAGDTRFVVPAVIPDYCTRAVLAVRYEAGDDIHAASVQSLPQDTRDALATAMLELFVHEFFEWGTVQTDPNFGNYRFRRNGDGRVRIVLLDFGATRSFSKSFVDHYTAIIRAALLQDRDQVIASALSLQYAF
ncbi:ABC1 kinase family protein [Solimonas marina]|uniref:AarF/ABC1/UbiB kinase family protein n=1 Tax=Solimonas marina TaxID=2714601 RepID=A0A970B5K2_9GAMM|nr:AarF/ABC1/UbiB kinase family protein [Solimonas marina]NKF21665.1 AarF/ABC1/UbiB kinase family protein [Solimonas marina]